MSNRVPGNHLRTHRKKTGLSQRQLGQLLGHADKGFVSRHERARALPSLKAAFAYEVVFRTPASSIFPALRENVAGDIEARLVEMEDALGRRSAKERGANVVSQQLIWLMERRCP